MPIPSRVAALALLCSVALACGPDPVPEGGRDAGSLDAGPPDGGAVVTAPDGGEADGGEPDGGEPDGGEPDGGEPDAGDGRCAHDGECAGSLRCDVTTGACVGCLADLDCAVTEHCADRACVPGCHADEGCVDAPSGAGSCDVATHRCVECDDDAACPAGAICRDFRCVQGCRDDAACGGDLKCCDEACVDVRSFASDCGACGNACDPLPNVTETCSAGACGIGRCADGFADCNGRDDDGCETEPASDVEHCGACGAPCVAGPGVAAVACEDGRCLFACADGSADCDGDPANGCEANLRDAAETCGTCETSCDALPGTAGGACAEGRCVRGACLPGRDDCDGAPENGCEVDLGADALHCGGCDVECGAPGYGTMACVDGACTLTCDEGRLDCDGSPETGCEVATDDPLHCGACDAACPGGDHVVASCVDGRCDATCEPGFADCSTDLDDGCETDLGSNVQHCGACHRTCDSFALGYRSATCENGACVMGPCMDGLDDCDGRSDNGCETTLRTSMEHCGACGRACTPGPNSVAAQCLAGACKVSCATGFADCDGLAANGCEVQLGGVEDCRTCGEACIAPDGMVVSCDPSAGCVNACTAGRAECDGDVATVCETQLATDEAHCGGCDSACAPGFGEAATCEDGACVRSCLAGLGDCDGESTNGCETDVTASAPHCGACGHACAAGFDCVDGACVDAACGLPERRDCDGNAANGCETDVGSSLAHCGACDRACTAPANALATCSDGTCGFTCKANWADCDGRADNGCEAALDTTSDCGACGRACSGANATASCSAGTCTYACASGWRDCDPEAAGCETPTTSPDHCTRCNNRCDLSHAIETCLFGTVCGIASCEPGWSSCDGGHSNGCEQDVLTSTAHCGACNRACGTAHTTAVACVGGTCRPTCSAGWGDCDGNPANGCEQSLTTVAHCGACNTRPPELANELDDDCDGIVDEGVPYAVIFGKTHTKATTWTGTDRPGLSSFNNTCPAGSVAIGHLVSSSNSATWPYLTDERLICAQIDLEPETPTRLRSRQRAIVEGTPDLSGALRGPSTGAQQCPDGSVLDGLRYGWVDDLAMPATTHRYAQHAICRPLYVDLVDGRWTVRLGASSIQGPTRGFYTGTLSEAETYCPAGDTPFVTKSYARYRKHYFNLIDAAYVLEWSTVGCSGATLRTCEKDEQCAPTGVCLVEQGRCAPYCPNGDADCEPGDVCATTLKGQHCFPWP